MEVCQREARWSSYYASCFAFHEGCARHILEMFLKLVYFSLNLSYTPKSAFSKDNHSDLSWVVASCPDCSRWMQVTTWGGAHHKRKADHTAVLPILIWVRFGYELHKVQNYSGLCKIDIFFLLYKQSLGISSPGLVGAALLHKVLRCPGLFKLTSLSPVGLWPWPYGPIWQHPESKQQDQGMTK